MITDVQRRRKLGKLAESKEAESYFVLLICSHSAQPQLSAILIRCPPAWWGWKLDITFWQIDLNNWGQEISWRRFFILYLICLFCYLFETQPLVALPPALTGELRFISDDNPRSLGHTCWISWESSYWISARICSQIQHYLSHDALAPGWKSSKTFFSNLWPITAFNFTLWANDWLLTFYENQQKSQGCRI